MLEYPPSLSHLQQLNPQAATPPMPPSSQTPPTILYHPHRLFKLSNAQSIRTVGPPAIQCKILLLPKHLTSLSLHPQRARAKSYKWSLAHPANRSYPPPAPSKALHPERPLRTRLRKSNRPPPPLPARRSPAKPPIASSSVGGGRR